MRGTENGYLKEQQQLLPMGHAWNREEDSFLTRFFRGLARGWSSAHNRALNLTNEADPDKTLELLSDWEKNLGLPDECSLLSATVQERRAAVKAKYLDEGRQDILFFYELAEALGYAITIIEYRPFICGRSRCRDQLHGAHSVRYYWKVKVHGPRVTLFRCGSSMPVERLGKTYGSRVKLFRCGSGTPYQRLGTVTRVQDLECYFNKYKEAHGVLIFEYDTAFD